jgi:hypothetical protein
MLLKKAMGFRYRYIPISSLQQGSNVPSDVAMAVLRDFVVLQGDGSSVSNSGSGWQYARDFGVSNDEWFAEKEQLKYIVGEPLVRRRVWMRLLVAQSNFFRANDLLNHAFNGHQNRHRGTIKTSYLDFYNSSWTVNSWTKSSVTLVDDEIIVVPDRGSSVRIPIKSSVVRKLAQGYSEYRREKLDTRCEIEIQCGTSAQPKKSNKSFLLRCKDEEERSDWICALSHQIVLLGAGGKCCYDECKILHPSPLLHGEMFIEVEINLRSLEARLIEETENASKTDKTEAQIAEDRRAALRRKSYRRGSTEDGVVRRAHDGSSMSAQEAAAKAAAALAEEAAASIAENKGPNPCQPVPSPSTHEACIEHSWQLRRFILFDEHIESHHCNDDMLSANAHAPWKIPLADFSYHESNDDPLLFVLESAERIMKFRCVSMDAKLEWREAFRRVLRARSYMALQSTFDELVVSSNSGSARSFTYSEDLVLVVKNNHVEEKRSLKMKPTVSQAQAVARAEDELLKGIKSQGEIPLATENVALRLLKEKEEAQKLTSRLYNFCVQIGVIRPLKKAPPLLITNAVTIAMNKIGLRTSRLFDGSKFWC